jgi:DNA polymerase III subunit epsilon
MSEIVLDTETTGLDPSTGDRIVEIGAVELFNHMPTGKFYHQYINPQRDMPEGAFNVHGLSAAFLSDKPVFVSIVDAFLEFVGDAKIVIHNASFDMKFINAELIWAKRAKLPMDQALDTLEIARKKFPGAQNSLDALCRRFSVDNSARDKHGALLDSELLAEVYLELVGGRQPDLILAGSHQGDSGRKGNDDAVWKPARRPVELPSRLSLDEDKRHASFVDSLGDASVWATLGKA